MNSMPLKVIRKDVYLQVKGPYRQLKDPEPKKINMGPKKKGTL